MQRVLLPVIVLFTLFSCSLDDRDFPDITVSSEVANVSGFEQNTFKMYPNPATSTVNFSQEVTATVFDITGKKVLSFENATSVNVSQLGKGVYFVKTNEGVTNKLIVK